MNIRRRRLTSRGNAMAQLRSLIVVLAAAAIAANLIACGGSHFGSGDVRPLARPTAAQQRVRGIGEAIANAGAEPVRVLAIHGMLTDSEGFSNGWQREIAKVLNLDPSGTEPRIAGPTGVLPS